MFSDDGIIQVFNNVHERRIFDEIKLKLST